jgi:hypothetical protein
MAISATQSAPDTLRVVFSELVTTVSDPNPFVFHDNLSGYSITHENPPSLRNQYSFMVTGTTKFPINGDSVNIDSGKIADKFNNFQDIVNNKRVPLKVHVVPYTLTTKIGPNPFNAGEGREVTITVVPLTKMVESVSIKANLTIYDQVGSVVDKMDTVSDASGAIHFAWKGTNKSGRLVGAGTYVAVMKTTDLNVNRPFTKKFMIGVKR